MAWQPQQGQYDSPYSDSPLTSPPMNGFKDHSLDDDAFGAKGSIVSAFDAFRENPPLRSRPCFTLPAPPV